MILPKYRPNFDQLDQQRAVHLAEAMRLPTTETISGSDIFEIADAAGMDQADVVMSLAADSSLIGISVIETIVGKPIERRRASSTPRVAGTRAPRVSVPKNDPRKIVFVGPNPKKVGSASHARFELYRVGMTVSEFVAAGGTTGDVAWDAPRGFIKLEGQE